MKRKVYLACGHNRIIPEERAFVGNVVACLSCQTFGEPECPRKIVFLFGKRPPVQANPAPTVNLYRPEEETEVDTIKLECTHTRTIPEGEEVPRIGQHVFCPDCGALQTVTEGATRKGRKVISQPTKGEDMAKETEVLSQADAMKAAFAKLGIDAELDKALAWLEENHPSVTIKGHQRKADWQAKRNTVTVFRSKLKAKGKTQPTSEKKPASKAAPVKQPASFPASNLADSSPNAGLTTVDLVRMAQTLVQQLGADEVHKLIDLERRDNP